METSVHGEEARRLPAGLTHAPSRARLAAGGLPRSYAYLDLTASHEPLHTAASWYDDLSAAEAAAAEGLIVLGEAQYHPELADEPATVLLDGATGEVYLAFVDDGGTLRRDLLASSLDTLTALMIEVEAVTAGAAEAFGPDEESDEELDEEEPDEEDGPRGPATVAEAAAISRGRMRAADPELFERTADHPAHWETAMLVRSLAWAALPGEPDGLTYALVPALVEELAELTDATVRRFADAELPPELTHAPTRRLLTELGLPQSGRGMLQVDPESPLSPLTEDDAEDDDADVEDDTEPEDRPYLALADWTYDLVIALDGTTGRLELPGWQEEGEPAAYLHHDVSVLLLVLWTHERLRAERHRWHSEDARAAWSVFDPRELLDAAAESALRAVDPEAFATEEHFWPMLAEDGHMGSLLE
ncbi:SUKH-4 family immunity protein [Kitasatospora sp. NPDC097643]|uniref:SUKH-4 family immunity protein n=1 Tax=Kitasatospora sp. NPDC097643 TaxID=3157230 RepID=UPI00331F16EC